jgi:hypothetical protein
MSLRVIALFIGSSLQLSCCSQAFSYPVMADVTRIEVTASSSGQLIKTIAESTQIDKVIRFIDERSRWCASRFRSLPVAPVTLYLQNKNNGKGKIGFGKGFFVAEFANGQYEMEISDDELRDFLNLIGASEEQLFQWSTRITSAWSGLAGEFHS